MKLPLVIISILICLSSTAQVSYRDSITQYFTNYVSTHEVVKGEDRKKIQFYEANEAYRVVARFEKKENMPWFPLQTSGTMVKIYRIYGVIHFTIRDTTLTLNLYQSQSLMQNDQYKDYLFLPFTDATTGNETYHGGRYIDILTNEIHNSEVIIDFNKAYNPYCAYVTGRYNCPIPPAENHLQLAIRAGEKDYDKND